MGRNLTNLYISQSFQYLTQISGSELQDGIGNTITGSLSITASLANTANTASYILNAVSASYAATSTSSSFATNATSASYATNALSASFATTASYALNAGTTVSTASLLTTASAAANIITFTKGDGSTFPITIATGSAVSASFATTASLALNNVLTASVSSNTITFTKGDGTTFPITVNTGSAVTVNTGSLLVTASISNATTTFTKGDGSTFSLTANNVVNATSASIATSASFATTASYVASVVSASYALSASQAATATTASFASTIANGLSPTFANPTASNVLITGTASIAFLNTTTISSSVIFTSGSNQLGDSPTLDTQSLYGKVIVTGSFASTGSAGFTGGDFKVTDQAYNGEFDVDAFKVKTQTGTQFTGSVSSQNGFTGSLQGTASFATTASYALNVTPTNTGSLLLTASAANNVITFTKGDGSTFPVTVSTGSAAAAFPYTGSAQITGSLAVTGSIVTNAPNVTLGTAYQDTVALGRNAGKDLTGEGYNVLVGADRFGGNEGAGSNITSGQENTVIGSSAGVNITDGSQNTIIGSLSHYGQNGSQNTMIGYANAQFGSNGITGNVSIGRWAGYEQYGNYNVLLGWRTGFRTDGNYNVFLGPDIQGQGAAAFTGSNFLALGSSQTPSDNLLFGYHGDSAQRFLNVKGNLNTSGSGVFTRKLTISQSVDDFTEGAFEIYSTRNAQTLIKMYEYGGQAYIVAPRPNGIMYIDGAGGINDFVGINYNSVQVFPGSFKANTPTTISSSLTLTGSLDVTGSVSGNVLGNNTDSYTSSPRVQQVVTLTQTEYNSIGSPDANTLYIISGSTALNTASFATTGSNTFVGNQTISGSLTVTGSATFTNTTVFSGSIRGEVNALSITSNTASLNCALDNFFTLTLVSGSNTYINPTNILPGQTINLRITQANPGNGTVSFPTSVKQVSGSAYVPTAGSGPVDILTFISFDNSSLYLSNVKNLV